MDSMDPMGYDLKRNETFEVIRGTWHMSPKEACLMSECQPSQIQIEKKVPGLLDMSSYLEGPADKKITLISYRYL